MTDQNATSQGWNATTSATATSGPNSGIVYVIIGQSSNGTSQDFVQASGVLISPDEVLTAAHVVHGANGQLRTSGDVFVNYDKGSSSSYSTIASVHALATASDYTTAQGEQYDYAVIHLATPVTGATTFSLGSDVTSGTFNVSGYPAGTSGALDTRSESLSLDGSLNLYVGTPLNDGTTPNAHGSSGGSVWQTVNGTPTAFGVISAESQDSTVGYFTQLTSADVAQINSWVTADDAGASWNQTSPSTPTPVAVTPTPVTPVAVTPTPVTPVAVTPTPVAVTPTPVAVMPTPVTPAVTTPTPVIPTPVAVVPTPAAVSPIPQIPAPVAVSPVPEIQAPAATQPTPAAWTPVPAASHTQFAAAPSTPAPQAAVQQPLAHDAFGFNADIAGCVGYDAGQFSGGRSVVMGDVASAIAQACADGGTSDAMVQDAASWLGSYSSMPRRAIAYLGGLLAGTMTGSEQGLLDKVGTMFNGSIGYGDGTRVAAMAGFQEGVSMYAGGDETSAPASMTDLAAAIAGSGQTALASTSATDPGAAASVASAAIVKAHGALASAHG